MGYVNEAGPEGSPDFNNSPQTTADLQRLRDLAVQRGNAFKGTTAARVAWESDGHATEGHIWYDTDEDSEYLYDGSGWLAFEEAFQTVSLVAGWAAVTAGIRFRKRGLLVEILPAEIGRTGSGATVNAGASITVCTMPAGYRPAGTVIAGSGTIGVNGILGASRWYCDSSGNLFFQSLVTSGTMAVGGAVGNAVVAGKLEFLVP